MHFHFNLWHALAVVFVILVPSTVGFLFTDAEGISTSQTNEGYYRELLCHVEPKLCDEAQLRQLISTHNKFVPMAVQALAKAAMVHSLKSIASSLQLPRKRQSYLLGILRSDPHKVVAELRHELARFSDEDNGVHGAASDPPYFGFVPKFLGRVLPQSTAVFTTPCFGSLRVSPVVDLTTQSVRISVLPRNASSASLCADRMYFSVGARTAKIDVRAEGAAVSVVLNLTHRIAEPALHWDLGANGVRIYRFDRDELTRHLNVIETILLFWPMITGKLDMQSALRNVEFLSNYTLMTPYPSPRAYDGITPLDRKYIRSGDLFAKLELDGLGPMEALGQGTTSGHVAFALWNETTDALYVCESVQAGITCTEWEQWTAKMQASNSSIVLVPLAPEFSASFNTTAAWRWVNDNLGNAYGFPNFFFGWIDTPEHNYPCFPWSWDRCLSFAHVELVMYTIDEILPPLFDKFFGQALNHRAATSGLNASMVFFEAHRRLGVDGVRLVAMPEQDSWKYNSTRQGHNGTMLLPSQVCSTLACNVLRVAGVFDGIKGELQCSEMTVWDIFSLNIFDSSRFGAGRPQVCIDADPTNYLCQLTGSWTFLLQRDVNSRAMFANMSEVCASRNPVPYDRTGCYDNAAKSEGRLHF